ncbi:MAG: hypothetical protein L0I76_05970 [Pseudonocardia sp.]|nr:hypothetical protein [Pseudonocardia sp.]
MTTTLARSSAAYSGPILTVPVRVEHAVRRVRSEQHRATLLLAGPAKYRRLSALYEQEARLWTLLVRHTAEPVHRRAASDAQCAAREGRTTMTTTDTPAAPAAEQLGVHLQRVYVLVDEVAELAFDHDGEKTVEKVLRELLRIVQLVRAMGIHVIPVRPALRLRPRQEHHQHPRPGLRARVPARQRSADCGDGARRTGHRGPEAGADPDPAGHGDRAGRPALAYARCSYLSTAETRALATAHSGNRVTWEQLTLSDRAAVDDRTRAA